MSLLDEDGLALLEKAREQKRTYNWLEAIKLYDRSAVYYIGKKDPEKVMEICIEIHINSPYYSFTVSTADQLSEVLSLTSKIFENCESFFSQLSKKFEKLICAAMNLGIIVFHNVDSIIEVENRIGKLLEICNILNDIYKGEKNEEINVGILLLTAWSFFNKMNFCSNPQEAREISKKVFTYSEKAWEISKNIRNIKLLIHSINLLSNSHIVSAPHFFSYSRRIRAEIFKNLIEKCEETLKIINKTDYKDKIFLGILFNSIGQMYCEFALKVCVDEIEQRKYFDKGLNFLEMSLDNARYTKEKSMIISSISALDRYALFSRKMMFLQSRIIKDLQEIESVGKLLVDYEKKGNFFPNLSLFLFYFLPMLYYSNISQMSFFTSSQRISYANKAIDYSLQSLKIKSYMKFGPWDAYSNLALTVSYAVLVKLTSTMEEQRQYIEKMLQYASEANRIGEKYGGGDVRAYGYSSLYRAYKTLADIAENEEERIKMLISAIESQEKGMDYATESRTGIIAVQLRLGLLYEELGILTKDNQKLLNSREIMLEAIKGSLERGYYSYAGTTYEYIARIEDRLGNHIASAEYYLNAKENHERSLESIEYRPLKKRINEKINYAHAWNLIEKAKAHHRNENHLRAKESYEKSIEILQQIPRYSFEGSYNSAWALLEEAELLSKQEKEDEAIHQYDLAIKAFEESIKILGSAFEKADGQPERERIDKLQKVAKVRISYCNARINLEEARVLGRIGDHSTAAEKFAIAASVFRGVCTRYKLERERKELEAIYYLCRAWESMELAEKFEEPERFEHAATLFTKASNLFVDTKLKLLASGNSSFCNALESGCRFDDTLEIKIKRDLYPKIKLLLSKAASSYGKGGFENVANWALATSIYFDAAWHLIQADNEVDIGEKGRLLGIGSNYLKSALELFSESGYENKVVEVQERLTRVEKEESILFSALTTIKEPSISRSTMGISAPTCPIESSESPRLGEAQQFIAEERRVTVERMEKKKYRLVYKDLIEESPKIQKRECKVGIAQIGVSNTGNIMNEFYEMSPLGLLTIKENKVEEIRNKMKNMIERAYNEGINVLLFPEMTIDLNHGELMQVVADLAKLYSIYIIPGSFHDQDTKKNISMVFGPEGILWEQEKHIPAVISIEAGKQFKEGIEVGSLPRKTIICNTEYGRFAIVICRDFLDMDLRVELKNFEPAVDIILNPAFTPVTADFNAAHFDARRSIYAYCFFANIAEFGNSFIHTPEKDRTERVIKTKEEGLISKNIDLFKLRSERMRWEKEQKKERKFIQSTR
ncbi:MAG: nitrilase-related carbon-nitrogen hydrolase [Promethearchaeota archaeon]|jgi:predicted amidohydrolase/predicted metal-dependent hydrolase